MNIMFLTCPLHPELEKLWKIVVEISSALDGTITALCVKEDISQKYYSPFSIQLGKIDKEKEKKVLEEVSRVLGEEDVMKIIRGGALVSQVLHEVEKEDYDMLIFGDVEKELTKKIAEYSHVPTLIYRRGEELKRILLCTDGSDCSLRAVRFVGKLARGLGSSVTVLSVAKTEDTSFAEDAVETASKILKEEFSVENVEEKVIKGSVREVILEEEKKGYDTIALAPRGLTKLHRVVLGHVSLHVLEKAESNVLLVR